MRWGTQVQSDACEPGTMRDGTQETGEEEAAEGAAVNGSSHPTLGRRAQRRRWARRDTSSPLPSPRRKLSRASDLSKIDLTLSPCSALSPRHSHRDSHQERFNHGSVKVGFVVLCDPGHVQPTLIPYYSSCTQIPAGHRLARDREDHLAQPHRLYSQGLCRPFPL